MLPGASKDIVRRCGGLKWFT